MKKTTALWYGTATFMLIALAGCGNNLKEMSKGQAKTLENTALSNNTNKTPVAEAKAKKAVQELQKAATKKNQFAEYYLALYDIKTKNKTEAVSWMQAAASQNYPDAELLLGEMYRSGYGNLKTDFTVANQWLNKAIQQKETKAELLMAVDYLQGKDGVKPDDSKGVALMREAAKTGIPVAEYMMYNFDAKGIGSVQANSSRASYWFQKVESTKSPWAKVARNEQRQLSIVQHEEATNSGPDTGRFSTDCDNMDCVRRYANGAVIHFTACMNPADMEPMDSAPVVDGQGECSGTDAEGNFYGMGSFN